MKIPNETKRTNIRATDLRRNNLSGAEYYVSVCAILTE